MFDKLVILGEGRTIYKGSVKNLVPFLGNLGYRSVTFPCMAQTLIYYFLIIDELDKSNIRLKEIEQLFDPMRLLVVSNAFSKKNKYPLYPVIINF